MDISASIPSGDTDPTIKFYFLAVGMKLYLKALPRGAPTPAISCQRLTERCRITCLINKKGFGHPIIVLEFIPETRLIHFIQLTKNNRTPINDDHTYEFETKNGRERTKNFCFYHSFIMPLENFMKLRVRGSHGIYEPTYERRLTKESYEHLLAQLNARPATPWIPTEELRLRQPGDYIPAQTISRRVIMVMEVEEVIEEEEGTKEEEVRDLNYATQPTTIAGPSLPEASDTENSRFAHPNPYDVLRNLNDTG